SCDSFIRWHSLFTYVLNTYICTCTSVADYRGHTHTLCFPLCVAAAAAPSPYQRLSSPRAQPLSLSRSSLPPLISRISNRTLNASTLHIRIGSCTCTSTQWCS